MYNLVKQIKKSAAISLLLTASLMSSTPIYAANEGGSDKILAQIAATTCKILVAVNNLPIYINQLLTVTSIDDSTATSNLQSDFDNYVLASFNTYMNQQNIQGKLLYDMYLYSSPITADKNGAISIAPPPNVYDITYQSLNKIAVPLQDPNSKLADPVYRWVRNASGATIPHVMPKTPGYSWGSDTDLNKHNDATTYTNYYNSVMAVQSYNAYILSKIYADYQNNNGLSAAQSQLVKDASDSTNWFQAIATEDIGKVIRQILMFDSQMYLLMTKLLDTQKELLNAQVMTNTLLILNNQSNENLLFKKASGQVKGS